METYNICCKGWKLITFVVKDGNITFVVKGGNSCLVPVKKILLIVLEQIMADDGLDSAESCCLIVW
jgi:hypothetical protein